MSSIQNTKPHDWVQLNVGGVTFTTTRATLAKDPESFLFRLCQEDSNLSSYKDERGAYMIDRDSKYFRPVLNYLRYGKLVIDKDVSEEGVLEEAEFYNVRKMISLLEERIRTRDLKNNEYERVILDLSNKQKHVHRLFHCHSNELPNFVTTLSDEWKIEQVINMSLDFPGENNTDAEFLCIISKNNYTRVSGNI